MFEWLLKTGFTGQYSELRNAAQRKLYSAKVSRTHKVQDRRKVQPSAY